MTKDVDTLVERAAEAEGEEALAAALALADAWLEDGTELERLFARHVKLTARLQEGPHKETRWEQTRVREELWKRVPAELWESSKSYMSPTFDDNGLVQGVSTGKGEGLLFRRLYERLEPIALSLGPLFRECSVDSHYGKRYGDEVEEEIAASFFASPHLARVRTLSAWGNNHAAVAMDGFAISEHLGNLRSLNLYGNRIDDDAARALARFQFDGVRSLDLHINRIGAEGCAALAASRLFGSLERLSLSSNPIGADGAEALVREPLPRLVTLALNQARVGDRGAGALVRAPWPHLVRLDLKANEVGSETLQGLSEAQHPALENLQLGRNAIDAGAIEALAATDGWPSLRVLSMSGNELKNDGVRALARWPGLATVHTLALARCGIEREGWEAFAASAHVGELETLHAGKYSTTKEDLAFLREALPHCKVT